MIHQTVKDLKGWLRGFTSASDEKNIHDTIINLEGAELEEIIDRLCEDTMLTVPYIKKFYSDINNTAYFNAIVQYTGKHLSIPMKIKVIFALLKNITADRLEKAILGLLENTNAIEYDLLVQYLGDEGLQWILRDFNNQNKITLRKIFNSKIDALNRESRMALIKSYLHSIDSPDDEEFIADLILSTPCTCDNDSKECDRHWIIDHPIFKSEPIERKMTNPIPIAKYLAAEYTNMNVLKKRKPVHTASPGKYIIFSDIHQGLYPWSWDKEDYFWQNKALYMHLLEIYFKQGYTLIENGDIEEFWLKQFLKSMDEHWQYQVENFGDLYDLRRKFHVDNRFIKIRGNHDNLWYNLDYVKKYLWKDVKLEVPIYEFALIGNEFLIMHGHQNDIRNRDIDSRKGLMWTKIGRFAELFIDTGIYGKKRPKDGWKGAHPRNNVTQRFIEDGLSDMGVCESYADLARRLKIYLICGHTHAPKCLPEGDPTFNSGCGVFVGIIYGIEIDYEQDTIRVVDWNDDQGLPSEPLILAEMKISDLKGKL
jgi:hypothetical protein